MLSRKSETFLCKGEWRGVTAVPSQRRSTQPRLGVCFIGFIGLPVFLILLPLLLLACEQPEEITMTCFLQVPCSHCAGLTPAQVIVGKLSTAARKHDHISIVIHDLEKPSGRAAFEEVAAEYNLSFQTVKLPLLVVNDQAIQGEQAVRQYADQLGK